MNPLDPNDPNRLVTKYRYDSALRLQRILESDDGIPDDAATPAARTLVTAFTYDGEGRTKTVTDAGGNVTQYAYDRLGRLIGENDPRGKPASYSYDAANRLAQITDRMGRERAFSYDDADRLTEENWYAASGGWGRIHTFNYAYNNANELIAASDRDVVNGVPAVQAASSLAFGYDPAGRLRTVDNADTAHVPPVLLTNSYDNASRRTRLENTMAGAAATGQPAAATRGFVTYAYDNADRLTRIKDGTISGGTLQNGVIVGGTDAPTKQVDFTYNRRDQFATIRRFTNTGSGTTPVWSLVTQAAFTYDAAARLTDLQHTGPSAVNQDSFSLGYDPVDRIVQVTTTSGIAALGSWTTTYNYDRTSQLTSVASPIKGESFGYDATGNRTTASSTIGGQTTTQTYAAAAQGNRLTNDGVFNYQYDDEGNLIRKTRLVNGQVTGETTYYTWDHRDRPVHVERRASVAVTSPPLMSADYAYDAFDRRITKTVDPDGVPADLVGLMDVYPNPLNFATWSQDRDGAGGPVEQTVTMAASSGEIAVVGDWDGDGDTNVGVFNPNTGTWRLDWDGNTASVEQTVTFIGPLPNSTRRPVVGDWDGDGDDDLGIYRYEATTTDAWGRFYLDYNRTGGAWEEVVSLWGWASSQHQPIVGDWDGDGDDDFGVYIFDAVFGQGIWTQFRRETPNGSYDAIVFFGTSSAQKPVAGDWDGDGDDNLGVFIPPPCCATAMGTWQFDLDGTGGAAERSFSFGTSSAGLIPVAGNWAGTGNQKTFRDSFVYDGADILLEFHDPDASGPQPSALRSRLLHGPAVDMLLAEEQFLDSGSPPSALSPSLVLFPLFDWLGSTRDLVQFNSSTGQPFIAKHIDYDSFGNVIRVTNGSGQPSTLDSQPSTRFLYTGREYDRETGLQYNRARYYDATIGRWLSEDPIRFGAGDVNLFRYVSNNPVGFTDPSGLKSIDPRWHHLLPQADEFKKFFNHKKVKIDIDDKEFGWIMDVEDHTGKGGLHPGWNDDWRKFFKEKKPGGAGATAEDIRKHLETVMKPKYKKWLDQGKQATLSYSGWKSWQAKMRKLAEIARQTGKPIKVKIPGTRLFKVLGVITFVVTASTQGVKAAADEAGRDALWPYIDMAEAAAAEVSAHGRELMRGSALRYKEQADCFDRMMGPPPSPGLEPPPQDWKPLQVLPHGDRYGGRGPGAPKPPAGSPKPLLAQETVDSPLVASHSPDDALSLIVPGQALLTGVISVSFESPDAGLDAAKLARLFDALAFLNEDLMPFGVTLVLSSGVTDEAGDIRIQFAETSVCGSAAEGVLGCTEASGHITILTGWSWYTGDEDSAIDPNDYDFQSVLTHEIGHALGFGHSRDADSVMFGRLSVGVVRRELSVEDQGALRTRLDGGRSLATSHGNPRHDSASAGPCGCPLCSEIREQAQCEPIRPASESPSSAESRSGGFADSGAPGDRRGIGYRGLENKYVINTELLPNRWTDLPFPENLATTPPNDVLVAGAGDDLQIGESGRDRLVGGLVVTSEIETRRLPDVATQREIDVDFYHAVSISESLLDELTLLESLGIVSGGISSAVQTDE